MKYFIRSVKYFFYFAFLTTAIVLALILVGAVNGNISDIFEGGYAALWKIAVFFALVAAIYPKLGFVKRDIAVERDWNGIAETAKKYFSERPYKLESETEDTLTFRRRSPLEKLTRMYEDRITLTRIPEGFTIEGLRKDAYLYASGLEHILTSDSAS